MVKDYLAIQVSEKEAEILLVFWYWNRGGEEVPVWIKEHPLWPGNRQSLKQINGVPTYVAHEQPLDNNINSLMTRFENKLTGRG